MNSKFQSLFKDTFIFAIGSLGSKVILFLLVPLYTNYLTTEEYGIADLVFTTCQLLLPFISVVIFEAVVRFGLMKNEQSGEVLKAAMIVATIGTIFAITITPLLNVYSPISKWKWYLCTYLVLNLFSNIEKSYLKVKDKNKPYALISILQTLCLAILNIILLACFHIGIEGYLIANIASMAVSTLLAAFAGRVVSDLRRAKFNKRLFWEMICYSAPLILNDLSWWVIHSSDKFMIELMVSTAALGIFTVSTKIPSLINVFISIFGQAWNISTIKEMDSSNDTSFYEKVFSGYSFITFLACLLIVSFIRPFMSVYVGADFSEAWIYVPLLLVSAVFSSISSYFGQLYAALKKSINNMLTTLLSAIINIIVNYFGILRFGVWGAILGTVVAYVVLSTVRMIDVKRFINIRINTTKYVINCLIVAVQAVVVSFSSYGILASIGCIGLFFFINRNSFHEMYGIAISRIKTIRKDSDSK